MKKYFLSILVMAMSLCMFGCGNDSSNDVLGSLVNDINVTVENTIVLDSSEKMTILEDVGINGMFYPAIDNMPLFDTNYFAIHSFEDLQNAYPDYEFVIETDYRTQGVDGYAYYNDELTFYFHVYEEDSEDHNIIEFNYNLDGVVAVISEYNDYCEENQITISKEAMYRLFDEQGKISMYVLSDNNTYIDIANMLGGTGYVNENVPKLGGGNLISVYWFCDEINLGIEITFDKATGEIYSYGGDNIYTYSYNMTTGELTSVGYDNQTGELNQIHTCDIETGHMIQYKTYQNENLVKEAVWDKETDILQTTYYVPETGIIKQISQNDAETYNMIQTTYFDEETGEILLVRIYDRETGELIEIIDYRE